LPLTLLEQLFLPGDKQFFYNHSGKGKGRGNMFIVVYLYRLNQGTQALGHKLPLHDWALIFYSTFPDLPWL